MPQNGSKTSHTALIALEDGTFLWGKSVGPPGETFGELVFNTGMTGYQEVLTDPSYRGQIVVMTYPEIGIYGVNADDVESREIQVAGFVVHRAVEEPFNQRAKCSLTHYLQRAGIVTIEGVDTRALTRHIRTRGAMRGAISSLDLDPELLVARIQKSPRMEGRDLVQMVSPRKTVARPDGLGGRFHIVVVDAGAKEGILRDLSQTFDKAVFSIVPYDADVNAVLSLGPDGVLVSNGPGDPAVLHQTIRLIRELLGQRIPLAGICLGHQLLGLAVGGQTYKMRFGHRGSNHPVKDLVSGRILITTQNHGFAIDPTSLGIRWAPLDAAFQPARPQLIEANGYISVPTQSTTSALQDHLHRAADTDTCGCAQSRWQVAAQTMAEHLPASPLIGTSPRGFGRVEITHLSLNDGTLEGLRLHDYPAFAVQYHPEASPGPHDAKGFFEAFAALMETHCA